MAIFTADLKCTDHLDVPMLNMVMTGQTIDHILFNVCCVDKSAVPKFLKSLDMTGIAALFLHFTRAAQYLHMTLITRDAKIQIGLMAEDKTIMLDYF